MSDNIYRYPVWRKVLIALFALVLLAIATWVTKVSITKEVSKKQYTTYNQQLQKRRADIQSVQMNALYSVLLKEFNNDERKAISARFYQYKLSIDGEAVDPKETVVYLKKNKVKITFFEALDRDAKKVLPGEILPLASVEDVTQVIKCMPESLTKKVNRMQVENGIRTDIIYENLVGGDIITLQINSEFTTKLGLENNIIELVYNVGS